MSNHASSDPLKTVGRTPSRLSTATLRNIGALNVMAFAVSCAWAQSGPQTSTTMDTVVVTSQKRAESVQDVPVSVYAITGGALEEAGISGVDQLDQLAAGLTVSAQNPGQINMAMRGISNLGGGLLTGPSVGYFLDETPMSAFSQLMPQLALWDAERVEVLRGPQGTLFGEGSMGGAIRVISAKPDARAFSGRVLMSASGASGGGQGLTAKGTLNVPLINDTLALRVTASRQDHVGWVDVPELGLKDVNKAKQEDARIALRWTPTRATTVDLAYSHQSLKSNDAWATEPGVFQPSALDPQMQGVRELSPRTSKFDLTSLTVTHDLGDYSLVGVASWFKQKRTLRNDYTPIATKFFGPVLGAGGVVTQLTKEGIEVDVNTQELRLVSNGDKKLDWTVGAYRKNDERLQGGSGFRVTLPVLGIVNDESFTTVNAAAKAWAAFGDLDYQITDKLAVQAGVRHYESDLSQLIRFDTTSAIFGTVAGVERPSSGKSKATTPKIGLRWSPSDTLMVYTRVADGFRDGGSNYQPPGSPEVVAAYGPEKVRAYEVGVKSQPMPWLTVNAALYRNDWTDLQLAFLTNNGLFNFIQNAGKAKSVGGEIEFAARPMAGLRLGLNLALVNATIDKDVFNAFGQPVAVKGNAIPYSPRTQVTLSGAYDFTLKEGLWATVSGNLSRRSSTFSDAANDVRLQNRSATLLNLRFQVNSDDNWSAGLFVNNATNNKATTSKQLLPGSGVAASSYVQPRTIGVEFSADF